jgi:hypothetical protein
MNMRKAMKILFSGVLLAAITSISFSSTTAQSVGGAHPLTDASADEIEQAALAYTRTHYQVLHEPITTLVSRSVIKEYLPLWELPAIDFAAQEPPLWLVLQKGDFDVSGLKQRAPNNLANRATYITYVFDLKAGVPTLILTSAEGDLFRSLLRDPALPEKMGVVINTPVNKLPYGSIAPTIVPSSSVLSAEP